MSFFNNLLGTEGLGGKQKLQAGLMAMMPMAQGGGGGFGGSLGRLFQGMGQARGWAGNQLPAAPNIAPMTPGQLPSPVQVPQGPLAPGGFGMPQPPPSVLPPAPNVAAGMVDPRRGRMQGLGFSGGYGGYGGGGY